MSKEAMKLALEALNDERYVTKYTHIVEAIAAIKEALAAPVQEPVALKAIKGELCYLSQEEDQSFGMWCPINISDDLPFADGTDFYTTPPAAQRQWVGLTDEEIQTTLSQLYCDINQMKLAPNDRPQKETVGFLFAKALEAKLKENT